MCSSTVKFFPEEKGKSEVISEEKLKEFILTAIENKTQNISQPMRDALYSYLDNQIKALSRENDKKMQRLPWSDSTLIKRAYELTEYRGLLTIADNAENKTDFNDNYLKFSEKFKIGESIKNGNVFMQYVHVVKLFRQIRNLNERRSEHIEETGNCKRVTLLQQCYDAMKNARECLINSKNEENSFWITTLLSLATNAMASVHYIEGNGADLYNLEKSREMLKMVDFLCTEGGKELKKASPQSIDFYTLNQSLISTLPYPSFVQQRDDIMKVPIWDITDDTSSSRYR